MKHLLLTTIIVLSAFAVGCTQQVMAQGSTNISPGRGVSAGKSYAISDIESIGLYGGNLMFNVPLGSLPAGRGGISLGVNLRYDSKLWDVFNFDIPRFTTTHDVKSLISSEEGGWKYGYKYQLKIEYPKYALDVGNCTTGNESTFYPYRFQLVTPDGGRHPLSSSSGIMTNENGFMNVFPDGRPACGTFPEAPTSGSILTYYTTDGTFLRLDLIADGDNDWENNSWSIGSRDGTRIIHNPTSGVTQRIADRNNNYVDVIENPADSNYSSHRTTYLLDQMARKVVIEYEAATNEDQIHSKGFAGETITTKVKWKNIAVNKFAYAGEVAPSPLAQNAYQNWRIGQAFRVVDEVILPEQLDATLKYAFDYNVDVTSAVDTGWGEVNKVTLPSGAFAEYDYKYDNHSGWNNNQNTDITTEQVLYNRVVEKRLNYNVVYDGTSSAVTDRWTYVTEGWQYGVIPDIASVEVTSPNGSKTKEFYGQDYFPNPPAIMPSVKGENYKTTGSDGLRIEKIYTSNVPAIGFEWFKANRYVKYEFTSISDSGGTPVKTAIKEYTQDKNGNTTEVKEYDFFAYSAIPRDGSGKPTGLPSGASGSLKRITKIEFYGETPEASSTTYTDADSYHLVSSSRLRSLPKSTEIQDGSSNPKSRSEITYDFTTYTSNTVAGNLTITKAWDSTIAAYSNPLASNYISTSASYDSYGNPTLTTDARGVQTTITYGSVGGYSGIYPTQVETASNYSTLKRTATTTYDFYTGLAITSTDVDNGLTNKTEYDELGRPTKAITAYGDTIWESWTTTEYHDQNRFVVVKSDLETKGDGKKVATQFFDQLGRVRLSKSLENAATQSATNETDGIKVQTRYTTTYSSGTGHNYQLSSNPYRATTSSGASAEITMGWTRSKAIHTGRHSEVETFSGASLPAPWGSNSTSTGMVQTDIDANATTVTDQANKVRRSITNGIGQLTRVDEPDDEGQLGTVASAIQPTNYSYDTLNNLTTVNQGVQTRSFVYDSMSRLKSATNPESGSIQYAYDNNSNLTTKTDARLVVTNYVYDALNRVTNRNYTAPTGLPNYQATPNVSYFYDGVNVEGGIANSKGKLTKVSSSVSTTEYMSFDILGKVTRSKQTTDGVEYGGGSDPAKWMTYTYNLSGAMVEQKYPSGRVVKNTLDADGDLSQVHSQKNATAIWQNYANSFVYTAAGAASSLRLGNGKFENTQFNSRLQPTQIGLGSSSSTQNLLKLNFVYGTDQNNGNVLSQTITVPTVGANAGFAATQTYTYDSLNRIKDATENVTPNGGSTSQSWKQTFLYDRYGNRNFDTTANRTTTIPTGCAITVCNPSVDPATNKLVGYQFDNAGNTKIDANGKDFTYDSENKQVEVRTAANAIVGQYFYDGDGKRIKKYVPGTGETTIFVYDASGKQIAEYSTIVANASTAKVAYLTADHIGSPRINTDVAGAVTSRHDYHPFGEGIATFHRTFVLGYVVDAIRKQFTGYERDNESSLDFAQARYYTRHLGRFTSPDEPFVDQSDDDPQSWNLYVYVRNNPSVFNDPTGMWRRVDCSSGRCWEAEEGDTFTSLAKLVDIGVQYLSQFFPDVKPNGIAIGQTFDLGGYDAWSIGQDGPSSVLDINDPTLARDIPREMQPDKPTNNPVQDGLRDFAKGVGDGVELVLMTRGRGRGGRFPAKPPTPRGVSLGKFGEIIKWGSGDASARARISTLTKQELVSAGVTRKMAEQWRDFYKGVAEATPKNPSASGRAELMQKAVDLLSP